jgi:hypothetical protein
MGGTEMDVKLEESQNTVKWLKLAIQDEHGISSFTQQLFLLVSKKSGDKDNAEVSVEAKQGPLKDDASIANSCIVASCVDFTAALNGTRRVIASWKERTVGSCGCVSSCASLTETSLTCKKTLPAGSAITAQAEKLAEAITALGVYNIHNEASKRVARDALHDSRWNFLPSSLPQCAVCVAQVVDAALYSAVQGAPVRHVAALRFLDTFGVSSMYYVLQSLKLRGCKHVILGSIKVL